MQKSKISTAMQTKAIIVSSTRAGIAFFVLIESRQ
jgi:hypothetical protein